MKKFSVICSFGAVKAPFNVYIGWPPDDAHPLEQQAAWLARERGGVVPAEVMNDFAQLHEVARTEEVRLEELAACALGDDPVADQAVHDAARAMPAPWSGLRFIRYLPGPRQQGGQ